MSTLLTMFSLLSPLLFFSLCFGFWKMPLNIFSYEQKETNKTKKKPLFPLPHCRAVMSAVPLLLPSCLYLGWNTHWYPRFLYQIHVRGYREKKKKQKTTNFTALQHGYGFYCRYERESSQRHLEEFTIYSRLIFMAILYLNLLCIGITGVICSMLPLKPDSKFIHSICAISLLLLCRRTHMLSVHGSNFQTQTILKL